MAQYAKQESSQVRILNKVLINKLINNKSIKNCSSLD